jgi:fructosamine-3-kinase
MSRKNIHYWKCDRPAAFHGTQMRILPDSALEAELHAALSRFFGTREVALSPGSGQGNHLTWKAVIDNTAMFIRVENGAEKDQHLAVESAILDQVQKCGVRTPLVYGCDASRKLVPFSWQALEHIPDPDLNHWQKQNCLDEHSIAFAIGVAVAKWQTVALPGFGVPDEALRGNHPDYATYFYLNLDKHLAFLLEKGFLNRSEQGEITSAISECGPLLALEKGCLVHKDLALWNILGQANQITAFIDFDDAISGDPTDDLSLLACFHGAAFLERALAGYETLRPLPDEFFRRFWLHLLRNMIIKAVIRVGAGYFDRDDQFFLIGKGGSGADLKTATRQRLAIALRGLRENLDLENL